MCVVSMIMDHYGDDWAKRWNDSQPVPNIPSFPNIPPIADQPLITPSEIEEFRKLLEKAREYDKKNNEPECELQEKKDRIKKLADMLGVKIDFV